MIQIFRKNQRVLMIVIACLTIVSFILLYNTHELDLLASGKNPSIYGKALNPVAIERQVKNYQLTLSLGQFELLRSLGGTAQDRDAALTDFVWNLLVLQHQSRALGIEPTDSQVANRIKEIPLFQTRGQFDPLKYTSFVSEQLTPRGFTERQLEEVMRDALRLESIKAVVGAPASLGAEEIKATSRIFEPATATVVKFEKPKDNSQIAITPEEVNSLYEGNKAVLQTQETRALRYVTFELAKDKKLEGKEKTEALQKLANDASGLVESMAQENLAFDKAAEKAKVKIQSLPAFDRTGTSATPNAAGSSEVTTALAPTAFMLSGPGKTSDIIQSGDAFYVFELTQVNETRPLTLDEAKPQIETHLRSQKSAQLFQASTTSSFNAMKTAMAAGKSLKEAATAQGLKSEELTNVVPAGETTTSDQQTLIASTLLLKPGELSNLEQAPWGAFVVQLQKRGDIDAKTFASREAEIRTNMLRNKQDLLFAEWLRSSREAAKISVPQGRGSKG